MGYGYAYDPPDPRPGGGPQPGAKALLTFVVGEWDDADFHDDSQSLGIYNPRDVCGNQWPDWVCAPSAHATGRAGDASFPVVRPHGHEEGWRLALLLVALADVLGIQEVIWAGQRWDSISRKWKPYSGRSDHFDHVHFALCKAAAAGLTIDTIRAAFASATDEEDDFMPALTEAEQQELLLNVRKIATRTHESRMIDEHNRWNKDALDRLLDAAGAAPVDVDEAALAAALVAEIAPILEASTKSLSDEDLARIAEAVNDELAERLQG